MRLTSRRPLALCLLVLSLLAVASTAGAQTTFPIVFHKVSDTDDAVDDFRSGFPAMRQCPAPCDEVHVLVKIINCSSAAQDGTCLAANSRAITGGVFNDPIPLTLPVDCSRGVVVSGAGTSDPPVCDTATNTVSVSNITVPAGETMFIRFWTGVNCDNGTVNNVATFNYDQNPDRPINSRDPITGFGNSLTFAVGALTPGQGPTKNAPDLPIQGTPPRRVGEWGLTTPWIIQGSNPNCSPYTFQVAWDDSNPDGCMDVDCSTLRWYVNDVPRPLPPGSVCPDPARPALFTFGSFTLQPDDTFRIEYEATFTRDRAVGECCNVMFFRTGTTPDATTSDPGLDTRLNPEYTCANLALATTEAMEALKDAEDAAGNRLRQVRPGDDIYWHFQLFNNGSDPALGTLTDTFPDAAVLDATSIVEPFPTGTCTITGQTLSCVDVDVPAGGGVPVEMRVRTTLSCDGLTGGDEICNRASVTVGRLSGDTHCTGCLASDPANLTCVELLAPSLAASPKTVTDASGDGLVAVGERLTYRISVINDGTTDATSVVVTDAIPPDTTYVAGSLALDGVALTDVADGDAGEVAGGLVTVRIPTVPVLDFSVGVVTFDVVVDARNTTQVCNAAAELTWTEATACGNPPHSVPAACMPFEPGVTPPNVTSTKTVAPTGTVDPGATLHYTITTCNDATAGPATNVKVTDDVPLGSTYVPGSLLLDGTPRTDAADGDGGDLVSPTTVSFSLGDLAPGACRTVELDVTVDLTATGDVVNVARITGDALSGVRSNQVTTPVRTTVLPPRLSITKTSAVVGGGDPEPGGTIRYTVVTCNDAAAGPAANVAIADPIPADSGTGCSTTFVAGSITLDGVPQTDAGDADGSRFESTPAPGGVLVDLATLAPGACATLTFDVLIAAACEDDETVENTASMRADGVPSTNSNTTTDVVVVDIIIPDEPFLMRQEGFPLTNRCPDFPTACGCEVGPRLDPATDNCEVAGTCSRTSATTWIVPNDLDVHVPLVFYELHRAGCEDAGDPTHLVVAKSGRDVVLSLVP